MLTGESGRKFLLWLLVIGVAGAPAVPGAQSSGERGSIPPGESRGASRPAEGAIRGGSIEADVGTSPTSERDVARCMQLTGILRDQCLRDRGAGAGASQPPPAPPSPVQRDPVTDPPPQNPRPQ
jgi:hypothetical protein